MSKVTLLTGRVTCWCSNFLFHQRKKEKQSSHQTVQNSYICVRLLLAQILMKRSRSVSANIYTISVTMSCMKESTENIFLLSKWCRTVKMLIGICTAPLHHRVELHDCVRCVFSVTHSIKGCVKVRSSNENVKLQINGET